MTTVAVLLQLVAYAFQPWANGPRIARPELSWEKSIFVRCFFIDFPCHGPWSTRPQAPGRAWILRPVPLSWCFLNRAHVSFKLRTRRAYRMRNKCTRVLPWTYARHRPMTWNMTWRLFPWIEIFSKNLARLTAKRRSSFFGKIMSQIRVQGSQVTWAVTWIS